jgi:signal transduction histidine kinase
MRYAYEARTMAQRINYDYGEGRALVNEAMGCRIKSDFKRSKQLATTALQIFERIKHKGGQADALNNIAFMELNMEDYENALEHGMKALPLAQDSNERDTQAFSFLLNGMLHEMLGDYTKSMEHHLKSLALSREIHDSAAEGAALINAGIVFRKIGEREKAKEHFEEAHQIFTDLSIQLMVGSSHFNLGRIYSESGNYSEALAHFNRCLQIQRDIGHAQGQGACYINIGVVLRKMGLYDEADENIRQSIELARSFGKKNSECKGMIELAECFLDQRMEHDAIDILEEVHNEAEIYGIKEIRQQVLALLSRAYEMRGDFKRAFSFYKEAATLHDELINEEIMLKMKGLMLLQELEKAKSDREIALIDKGRAEQSEKFKEQFLANMSHEIRTPMNAIAGLAELLGKTQMNPIQSKYVKAIRQSTESLLGIIQDILDFSKIEAGQTVFESVNFSIRECLDEVCNSLRHRAEEKSILLEEYSDEKIPTVVSGDSLRLKQILLNLIGNGIKFTEKGGVKLKHDWRKQKRTVR